MKDSRPGCAAPAVQEVRGRVSHFHVYLQQRIATGVKQMLQLWFDHKPFPEDFYIVREGKLAEQYT